MKNIVARQPSEILGGLPGEKGEIMKMSEMKCVKCIKFDGSQCRLSPGPLPIVDPEKHWCAQGQWQAWSDRYEEMEPYFWGEWEQDEHGSA